MNSISKYIGQTELTLQEFIYLELLYYGETELATEFYCKEPLYYEHLEALEVLGYIKIIVPIEEEPVVELRDKGIKLFGDVKVTPAKRAELLTEAIRNVFPEGVNSGGYRYRGDKQGVKAKLLKFIKTYPKYTDEEIIQAARQYVNRFKPYYAGMRQAHYFIQKDSLSDLLGELENLQDSITEVGSGSNSIML